VAISGNYAIAGARTEFLFWRAYVYSSTAPRGRNSKKLVTFRIVFAILRHGSRHDQRLCVCVRL